MSLVYSTEVGRLCPKCRNPIAKCECKKQKTTASGDGIVRVGRSTKGRKGKGVTVITGLNLKSEALKAIARDLKQKCGSGGTIKDGVIEIQGEHRNFLVEELIRRGYTAKKSGG